jgi:hypothetical protein
LDVQRKLAEREEWVEPSYPAPDICVEVKEEDFQSLDVTWSDIVGMRNFQPWLAQVQDEGFRSKADFAAMAAREKHLRDNPDGADAAGEKYKAALHDYFVKYRENVAGIGSRLDRALTLYHHGLRASRLHRFLSMFLALEVLFNAGDRELTHTLSTRCARILAGEDKAKRLEIADRIVELYNTRSRVVHGQATLGDKSQKDELEAIAKVAQTLRAILHYPKVCELLATPDAKSAGSVVKYFRRLELDMETLE